LQTLSLGLQRYFVFINKSFVVLLLCGGFMALLTNDFIKANLGVDLEIELQNDDDPSNKVDRFLNYIEDWCYTHLRLHYALNENLEELPAWRVECFKKGVIRQIEYVLRNGKISLDAGILKGERGMGTILSMEKAVLARDAYTHFYLGGFCNIQNDKPPYEPSWEDEVE
jgi:hypothetical protein